MVGTDEELADRPESLAAEFCSGAGALVTLSATECAARLSPHLRRRARRLLRIAELACDYGLWGQSLRHARWIDPAELGAYGIALLLWMHDLLPGNASEDPALAQKLVLAAARRAWWRQTGADERSLVIRAVEDQRSPPRDAADFFLWAMTDPVSLIGRPLPDTSKPSGSDDQRLIGQVAHLTGGLDRAALLLEAAKAADRSVVARLPRRQQSGELRPCQRGERQLRKGVQRRHTRAVRT